jgi:hypothetical protein
VPGGQTLGGSLASAELYDPASNSWAAGGALATARGIHTATVLPSGKVMVTGGIGGSGFLASAELYDPASNSWAAAGALATARYYHTATLLPSGKVLVAGGANGSGYLASAELFDPGLVPSAALQPTLNFVNGFLLQTSALAATSAGSVTFNNAVLATGFLPRLEASGGASNNSASNAPVFQVQRLDNDEMRFVPNDGSVNFTDTTFTGSATALAGFPAGPVRVRVWVNGVPSAERYSTLAVAPGNVATPTAIGGNGQATVNFSPVSYDGGAPVTSYAAIAVPGLISGACIAPCTSIMVTPLAAGTYTFVVVADNAAGLGPFSPASNAVFVYPADDIFHNGFEATP